MVSYPKVKFNSRVNLARIAPQKIKWLTRGFWRGATRYEITLELTARLTVTRTWNNQPLDIGRCTSGSYVEKNSMKYCLHTVSVVQASVISHWFQ